MNGFGPVELIIILIVTLLSCAFPAAILAFLYIIYNKLQKIEQKVNYKSQ